MNPLCGWLLTVVCCVSALAVRLPRGSGNCELISDADHRAACRAISTGKVVHCETIRDSDGRHLCRGIVTGKSIYCESIRDTSVRMQCRVAVARRR